MLQFYTGHIKAMGTRITFTAWKGGQTLRQEVFVPFHYIPTNKELLDVVKVAKEFKLDNLDIEIRHNVVN